MRQPATPCTLRRSKTLQATSACTKNKIWERGRAKTQRYFSTDITAWDEVLLWTTACCTNNHASTATARSAWWPPTRPLKLHCLLAARAYYYYYSLNSNSVQSTWTRAPHTQTGAQPHASLDETKSMVCASSRVYKRPTSILVTVRTNGTALSPCLR